MPFPDGSEVVVKQLDDENWEVRKDLKYDGQVDSFTVPIGSPTDFASVPRVFVWFLPRYGSYTMAAILHDYLWRARAAKGKMDWVDADGIFRRAMRELEVPFLRRWIMWAAVRWTALFKHRGRKGWWPESWRVILFSLLALPFVAPPGFLVLLALLLFDLVELVFWIPIRIGAWVRTRVFRQVSVKTVHLPRVEWKTSQ
jgi:Protein of unknown function (DUF1353)